MKRPTDKMMLYLVISRNGIYGTNAAVVFSMFSRIIVKCALTLQNINVQNRDIDILYFYIGFLYQNTMCLVKHRIIFHSIRNLMYLKIFFYNLN